MERFGSMMLWNRVPEFSVAHFVRLARSVIVDIHKRKKLPIVVGGTGFLSHGAYDGD